MTLLDGGVLVVYKLLHVDRFWLLGLDVFKDVGWCSFFLERHKNRCGCMSMLQLVLYKGIVSELISDVSLGKGHEAGN